MDYIYRIPIIIKRLRKFYIADIDFSYKDLDLGEINSSYFNDHSLSINTDRHDPT